MLLNNLRYVHSYLNICCFGPSQQKLFGLCSVRMQSAKAQEMPSKILHAEPSISANSSMKEVFSTTRVVPMVLSKEPVVMSFDEVPGPKTLKYLPSARYYLSQIGTQLTAGALTLGVQMRGIISKKKYVTNLTPLFEEYGPVVRFISPVGADIVLINHPDHIQKISTMEGDHPIRSTLDSLEKYRKEHRNQLSGLYSITGQDWIRQRSLVEHPLQNAVANNLSGITDICESFTKKLYGMRNHQDEVQKDLYKELHKWAFDCMGLIIFSKKFSMLDTELVYSQCDMSWLYHSLEKATDAIVKCESGLQLWKVFPTAAWYSLLKHCDSMDNLIGKHVVEAEQSISIHNKDGVYDKGNIAQAASSGQTSQYNAVRHILGMESLIASMLLGEHRMTAEDISTVLMDMLLIGVNTISTSISFLLFNLAKHQRAQRILTKEIDAFSVDMDAKKVKESCPYLQSCIKETLRLVPPIPILTRVLPKNITLDKYNIPRNTLIIMSIQDAALNERNFTNGEKFWPDRWLSPEAQDYHAFACIPFGFGARKCLGQNIAETLMSLLTVQILQKYKLEYHYGDIAPTNQFICKPNKPLKIRFIDRT